MKKYILLPLLLAACAKSPESISPSYTSAMIYQNYDCYQIALEYQRTNAALATASQQQKNARSGDVLGVLFLGIPVSGLSGGNMAAEVGRLKGMKQALEQASIEKRCTQQRVNQYGAYWGNLWQWHKYLGSRRSQL